MSTWHYVKSGLLGFFSPVGISRPLVTSVLLEQSRIDTFPAGFYSAPVNTAAESGALQWIHYPRNNSRVHAWKPLFVTLWEFWNYKAVLNKEKINVTKKTCDIYPTCPVLALPALLCRGYCWRSWGIPACLPMSAFFRHWDGKGLE